MPKTVIRGMVILANMNNESDNSSIESQNSSGVPEVFDDFHGVAKAASKVESDSDDADHLSDITTVVFGHKTKSTKSDAFLKRGEDGSNPNSSESTNPRRNPPRKVKTITFKSTSSGTFVSKYRTKTLAYKTVLTRHRPPRKQLAKKMVHGTDQTARIDIQDPVLHSHPNSQKKIFDEFLGHMASLNDGESPKTMCPFCLIMGKDPYHKFGKVESHCGTCCYGCGVHQNFCPNRADDYQCRSHLYHSKAKWESDAIELLSDNTNQITSFRQSITNLPDICKCCLCPKGLSGCWKGRSCFATPNKYFVWRFCLLVRHALHTQRQYPEYDPSRYTPDIPQRMRVLIQQSITDAWKADAGHVHYMSRYDQSPFYNDWKQASWSKWLLSCPPTGGFYNYMFVFKTCYKACIEQIESNNDKNE